MKGIRPALLADVPGGVACRGYQLNSGWPCARAATVRAVVGCKHEHVGPREFCGWHLDDVERQMMHCGECHELGHTCILRSHQVEPLGSEQAVAG